MNLIIVFTPFQFINATNFIKNTNEPFKLIVLTTKVANINQIEKIDQNKIGNYPFKNFKFLNTNLIWFLKLLFVRKFTINNYEKIIIGNYNDIVGYLLALRFFENNKEVILLDDGLATFQMYTDRNMRNQFINDRLFGGRGVRIYKRLFNLNKDRKITKLTFFTSYDLKRIADPVHDKVINFNFKPNKNMAQNIDRDLVWFIGSPLVKLKFIKEQLFIDILIKINKETINSHKNLEYILHRFEEPYNQPYIKFVRFDSPIEELFFNGSMNLPGTIISFYSSALLNIANIENSINCYYINITKYENNSVGDLKQIYDFFDSVPNMKEYHIKMKS